MSVQELEHTEVPVAAAPRSSRWSPAIREALWIFLLSRAALTTITVFAVSKLPGGFSCWEQPSRCVQTFFRYDIGYYAAIAVYGYWDPRLPTTALATNAPGTNHPESVVFFPLWPTLMRWLAMPFGLSEGTVFYAALAMAAVCLLVTYWLLYKLVDEIWDAETARAAVFLFAFSPFAAWFAAGYAEVLLVPLSLAVFLLIRHDRLWLAGALGGLATLTKPNAVLLVIPFLVLLVETWDLRGRWRIIGATALVPTGLLGYMTWLWWRFDAPLSFSHMQQEFWHREPVWPWEPFVRVVAVLGGPDKDPAAHTLVDLVLVLGAVAVVAAVCRRLPADQLLFFAGMLTMTLLVASDPHYPLASLPRHLAGAFPLSVACALACRHPRVRQLVMVGTLSLFGLFTALYTNGVWVA
ncbi:DUF2029 domain-containing protein [Pseudonocardiaceae bacterium YIM PH 21723]|nr:DUF2029 domain-containing protein [Pseudonocardiaceae bacterium YIM PH 21723]